MFPLLVWLAAAGTAPPALPPLLRDPDEPIRFPADAGVIDVTKPPYSAKGDGLADDTDAIQRALDDHPSDNRIIYLPDGVYRVTQQLEFGLSRRRHPHLKIDGFDPKHQRLTILQGQSRDGTIIRLADQCPGFQTVGVHKDGRDIGRPLCRGVVWTGENVAQHFRNAVRNLTIDTGRGNPGAAALQFNASNQGCVHAVKLVSGDGAGAVGLDIGFTGDSGPAAARHLEVVGFDYGVWASNLNSFTVWDVQLRGQRVAGIRAPFDVLILHRVRSDNRVPALWVGGRWSCFVTLLDGEFVGGAADQPAIRLDGPPKDFHLFARDVRVEGYGQAVKSADPARDAVGHLHEYSHGPLTKAFPDCVERSLRLPVKEAPAVPWGDPATDWANVLSFGAKGDGKTDDTAAVQKAIDSGKPTVYLPGGKAYRTTALTLRPTCQRIIACEAYFNCDKLEVADGDGPVVLERFMPTWDRGKLNVYQRGRRPLVVRDANAHVHQEAAGDVFLDDVCGALYMRHRGASAWCRYFNYEVDPGPGLVNEGGNLWVVGSKVEHPTPQVELLSGSRTELFGAMWYAGFEDVVEKPGLRVVDSAVTLVGHRHHSFGKGRWKTWVEVERKGERFRWTDWALDFLSTATPADLPPRP